MRLLPSALIFLFVSFLTVPLRAAEARPEETRPITAKKPYQIFFIGHSLFGFGNVPAAVQLLSEAASVDRPIQASTHIICGATHQVYWNTPEVMKRLREEEWDMVIIAGNLNSMSDPSKVNLEYAKKLDDAV